MTDTPDFIARKQFEIIQAKSVRERFEIFEGMMNFVRQMTIKRIKKRLGEVAKHSLNLRLLRHTMEPS